MATVAAVPPALIVLHYWLGDQRVAQRWNNFWLQRSLSGALDWPSFLPLVAVALAVLPILLLLGWRDASPWSPELSRRFRTRAMAGKAGSFGAYRLAGSARLAGLTRGRANAVLLVSAAAIVLLLIAAAWTGRVPGWPFAVALAGLTAGAVLREIRLRTVARLWRRKAPAWAILALLQISLLAAFAVVSAWPGRGGAAFAAPALLSAAILGSRFRRKIPAWGWISLLAIAVRGFRLDSWLYALIGDEYGFRAGAQELVDRPLPEMVSQVGRRLFEILPGGEAFLDRALQSLGMLAGGTGNFGWKLSTLWLPALAIPFYFGFFRTFAGRRIAVIACFLIASSEYLMSFSKIGYPTLHAHFVEALVLAAAAWAIRSRRLVAYACLGLAAASSLYVFPAVLYGMPVFVILLALYDPPKTREALLRWGTAAGAFLAAAAPMLLQAEFYASKLHGTFYVTATEGRAGRLAANVLYAALAHLRRPIESHYVGIGFLDPVTGALLAIGAALVLTRAARDRFALFCLAAGTTMLLLVSTGAEPPSATRMFVLLPGYALLAGAGLAWILDRARDAGLPPRGGTALCALALALVLASNLIHAYVVSPLIQDRYQGFAALYQRVGQRMRVLSPDRPNRTVILVTSHAPHDYEIAVITETHRLPPFTTVRLAGGRLPAEDAAAILDPDTVVMQRPDFVEADAPGIAADLRAAGKYPCEARDLKGRVRLVEWQSPERPRYCD